MGEQRLVLEAGGARVLVLPEAGGRLGSLVVDGRELLVTDSLDGPIYWGCYPMAPWAGRIDRGRFTFDGRGQQLPLGMPPHAIHGVVYDRAWTVTGDAELAIELDERWPYRGRVTQRFALAPGELLVTMTLDAAEPMPAVLGWHPWFRRVLAPVELAFHPGEMLVRGPDGIPTGERVTPPPGPWDDAFTDLAADPVLEWPGQLRLTIGSDAPWWVVYSQPEDAICVEPQSGPPDGLNRSPRVVQPGEPFTMTMRWAWEPLA
jgi:aldose 1-epimerase